jgi:hypothetical protein
VLFRFQVGYTVDQGMGFPRDPGQPEFTFEGTRATRLYTLGDAVVGTNGILQPSLSTYFAARFQFDQDGPASPGVVPSVYDATERGGALLIRSAYAQLDRMGPRWLRPLFLRAGRQFRHGPAIAHFDGISAAYDTRPLAVSMFYGRRVSLYGPGSDPFGIGEHDPGYLGGASAQIRFRSFARVPVVVGAEVFQFDDVRLVEAQLRLDLTPSVAISALARTRASELAHTRAGMRARLGHTTTLSIDFDERRDEWIYDYVVDGTLRDENDPRRYLGFGPVVRRSRLSARFGTAFLGNFDVLLFGTWAREHDQDVSSSFAPTYVELGGAAEARFLASLSANVELRARTYEREPLAGANPFVDDAAFGERGFRELMTTIRYSAGMRRFSAEVSGFARIYDLRITGRTDVRAGGHMRIEGWFTRRFRFMGEYELVGVRSPVATDLEGLQSLRLLAEASF